MCWFVFGCIVKNCDGGLCLGNVEGVGIVVGCDIEGVVVGVYVFLDCFWRFWVVVVSELLFVVFVVGVCVGIESLYRFDCFDCSFGRLDVWFLG